MATTANLKWQQQQIWNGNNSKTEQQELNRNSKTKQQQQKGNKIKTEMKTLFITK